MNFAMFVNGFRRICIKTAASAWKIAEIVNIR